MTAFGFTLSVLLGILDLTNVTSEISNWIVVLPFLIGLGLDILFGLLQIGMIAAAHKSLTSRRTRR